ncbi:MAG TPA: acyl carrier protein, partial [Longimicrobiaceae bacterium]|nr:acyl carrier protein [Longimicrobiaceae bacterium]
GERRRSALAAALEDAPPARRRGVLVRQLQEELAGVLGVEEPGSIRPEQGFFQMGMTSLQAVELRNRLEAALGRGLPSTLAFDHPTVGALAGFLLAELLPEAPAAPAAEAPADELEALDEDELLALFDRELEAINE